MHAGAPRGTSGEPLEREDDDDADEAEPSRATTSRPAYKPSEFARRVETAVHASTQPPAPTCEMLRDSCRAMRVADIALEEIEVGWGEVNTCLVEPKKNT